MSSRKRIAKMPKVAPQKDTPLRSPSYLNVSSIEKDSFFHENHDYGHPMHSTALEEDLSLAAVKKDTAQRGEGKRQPHQSGPVLAHKKASQSGRGKAQTKGKSSQASPAKALVPGKTARKSQGLKDRPVKKRLKGAGEAAVEVAADPAMVSQLQAVTTVSPSSTSPTKKRRRRSLSPEDITNDEDPNWNLVQKRAKTRKSISEKGSKRKSSSEKESNRKSISENRSKRKSSSEKGSNRKSSSEKKSNRKSMSEKESNRKSSGNGLNNRNLPGERQSLQDKMRKSSSGTTDSAGAIPKVGRLQRVRNPGELDVVLEHFLEFTSLYSEAVESKEVCQAIDALSYSVQEQLSEKISAAKELNCLRRDTRKVASTINKKRERLLEAKNEAIRKEKEVRELQREKARMQQRLEDLQKGSALLSGLANLHRSYLKHAHLDQPQQYGVSSLPALLLEAQCVLGTEKQLKSLNGRLEKALQNVT